MTQSTCFQFSIKFFFSLVISFCVSGVFLLAGSDVSALPLSKVPVKIRIPTADLANLTQKQREEVEAIAKILESHLYEWSNLAIELPPTVFHDGSQIHTLQSLLQPPQGNEAMLIGQERRKISEEQSTQLYEEGILRVPSLKYPGREHVWRVRMAFVKGLKEIQITWQKHKDRSLDHLVVSIPNRLFGDSPLSLRRGVTNLWNGLREILDLAIGLPNLEKTFTPEEALASVEKTRNLLTTKKMDDQDVALGKLRKQLNDPKLGRLVENAVDNLVHRFEQKWKDRTFEEEPTEEEKQNALYQLLSTDETLNSLIPGIGSAIVAHGRALAIVRTEEARYEAYMRGWLLEVEASLKLDHPILARNPKWLEKEVQNIVLPVHRDGVFAFYETAANKVEAAGYVDEAQTLREDIEFLKTRGRQIYEIDLEDRKPSFKETIHIPILRKSLWSVRRSTDIDGKLLGFTLVNSRSVEVNSGSYGWRLAANFLTRMRRNFYWTMNEVFLSNLWNGQFGLKSLVKKDPFAYKWRVNQDLDLQIENQDRIQLDTLSMRETLASRRQSLIATGNRMITSHENTRNFGLLPKSFQRFLLWFPADFGLKFLLPKMILPLGQTLATVGNVAVSGGIMATSVGWAPVSSLIQAGWDALVYDTLHANNGNSGNRRWIRSLFSRTQLYPSEGFPQLKAERAVVNVAVGVVEAGAALSSAASFHPLSAIGNSFVGKTEQWIRSGLDKFWVSVIRKHGRVPGEDTFVATLISGPDVDQNYFFAIKPESALASLIAKMEMIQVSRWQDEIEKIINMPSEDANAALAPFEFLLGAPRHRDSLALKGLAETRATQIERLRKLSSERIDFLNQILKIPAQAKGRIKLSKADLETMKIQAGQIVMAKWNSDLLKSRDESVQRSIGKRSGGALVFNPDQLSELLLIDIFGEGIFVPLEDAGDTIVVNVDQPDLVTFVREVMNADLSTEMPIERSVRTSSTHTGSQSASIPQVVLDAKSLCSKSLMSPAGIWR